MKKRSKRMAPAVLAFSMAFAQMAYGAEFSAEPGNPYDAATEARLKDNVLEYDEIELLIDAYNPTLKNLRETYQDNKDAAKDVAKLKEQVMEGSGALLDTASNLSDTASMFENMLGQQTAVTPAAYANMVYSSELLSQQAEQMALSADSMTEVTPEMLKVQVVDTNRAALIAGAQSAMVGYEQLLLQKESLEDSIDLLEAVYTSTQSQASVGMATQNDVLKAKQSLDSAKAGLLTIDINEQKIRQSLCTMLGWEYNANPEIQSVPAADLNRISQMNPQADQEAAINNNFTLKYNRLSYETMTAGSVEQKNMERTMEQQKAQIASSLVNLYNDVLQKKSEYDTAAAALELEKTKMDSADRKMEVQTIGRLEYRQQQNAYKTKEIELKNAKLALFQSMETYDWAVNGNLSIS